MSWSSDLESETVTRAPRDFRNSAEATPERPSPTTSTRLPLSSMQVIFTTGTQDHRENNSRVLLSVCLCVPVVNSFDVNYRSFSVVSANSANTSEAIQKRTMILDSDHPINSK